MYLVHITDYIKFIVKQIIWKKKPCPKMTALYKKWLQI